MQSFLLLLVATTFGCAARSDWSNPGTTIRQQFRAMRHDPYADVDIGPQVIGGRPREYQLPVPQAVRNQPYPQNLGATPIGPWY